MRKLPLLLAALSALVICVVHIHLAASADGMTMLASKTAPIAYGDWLCHIGWKGEGCGGSARSLPAPLQDLQHDSFDSDFSDVFDKWEKATGNQRSMAERVMGCDNILGSGKTIDGCGDCGGKGGDKCKTRKGMQVEYWPADYDLKQIPVQTGRPMRIWGETDNNGRMAFTSRSSFHTDRGQRFSVRYSGLLLVPKDEMYGFILRSTDGSKLFIDGRMVVNNDGVHPQQPSSGIIALLKGYHEIRIEYFSSGKSDPYVKLQWQSDSMKRRVVKLRLRKGLTLQGPPRNLSYRPPPRRRVPTRVATKKKVKKCARFSTRDWKNVRRIVRVCPGQTQITSRSLAQAATRQCRFTSDFSGVEVDSKGQKYRALFRSRCGAGTVYGKWIGKGDSTAVFKKATATVRRLPRRKPVNVCREVETKDWKNRAKTVKICSGQRKVVSRGLPMAPTRECQYRRDQSGVQMDKYGRMRAFYRSRCAKNGSKYGKWMRVGVSSVQTDDKKKTFAFVRFNEKKTAQSKREDLCEDRVRYLFRSVLRRSPDPAGFKHWVKKCVGGTTYDEIRKAFINSAEYQRKFAAKAKQLNGGGRIQSGTTWWGAFRTRDWKLLAGNGVRTSCHGITFKKAFSAVPKISLFMYATDFVRGSDYYRIKIEPRDVRTNEFKVCFTSWVDSRIYSVGVTWVAVDSTLSGVLNGIASSQSGNRHPLMTGGNTREDAQVRLNPFILSTTPALLYGFQQLDVWRGANLRVNSFAEDISRNSFKMSFQTWAGSKIWSMSNSYLALDPSRLDQQGIVVQSGAFTPTNSIQPRLWPMPRPSNRIYDHCVSYPTPFAQPPQVVIGMRQLDVSNQYNVRAVATVHSVTKTGFCVQFRTWHTSQVWSIGVSWLAYRAK